jgi:hypothetical protein
VRLSVGRCKYFVRLVKDRPVSQDIGSGLARMPQRAIFAARAADLKFLQHLQQTREGTSNRKAALES